MKGLQPGPPGVGVTIFQKNKRYSNFKCFRANSHPINCAHLVAIPIAFLDTTTNCTSPPCFNCYCAVRHGATAETPPLPTIDITSVFDLFAFLPIFAPMSRAERPLE